MFKCINKKDIYTVKLAIIRYNTKKKSYFLFSKNRIQPFDTKNKQNNANKGKIRIMQMRVKLELLIFFNSESFFFTFPLSPTIRKHNNIRKNYKSNQTLKGVIYLSLDKMI